MIVSSQLLHQLNDPTLSKNKRAELRCQLAKQLEDIGSHNAAREVMGELWPGLEARPIVAGLSDAIAAEVLLRVGTLMGWIGSAKQIEGAQEKAKNFISESYVRDKS